jgi:hypothetical protein
MRRTGAVVATGVVVGALFALALAACGGGSSGTTSTSPRPSVQELCAVEQTAPTAIIKGPSPNLGTPAGAKHDFVRAKQFLDRAAAVAPGAVRSDLRTMADAMDHVVSRLAAVHYDVKQVAPDVLESLSSSPVKSATTRVEQYIASSCAATTRAT